MNTFSGIKKIVVATDFSDNAQVAYCYALHLAEHLNAEVQVVHFYENSTSAKKGQKIGCEQYGHPTSHPEAHQQLTEFIQIIKEGNEEMPYTVLAEDIQISTQAEKGVAADKLIELSKDPTVDLLVLGAAGENGWIDKIFGSIAIKVATEASCPVMLIPHNAPYRHIQHIVYCASLDSAQPKDILKAVDFAQHLAANVHFVHVNTPNVAFELTEKFLRHNLLQHNDMPCAFDIQTIRADSVIEGIYLYTQEHNMDLIISVTHHPQFWEDVMHTHTSASLAWNAQLPIMILHGDKVLT